MSKSNQDKYKKLTDIEHVLQRSNMYLGNTNDTKFENSLVMDKESNKFVKKNLTYNPALIKMVAEVLDNSVDESKRNKDLNRIKVDFDIDKGWISIFDNGGIPVEMHEEYDQWIPEMIFSSLRCGSNYNDDEERTQIGTNGVGSTLTNIFSTKFTVETSDGKKHFKQTFKNNLFERDEAQIKDAKDCKGFTKITFYPDLERLGTKLDEDTVAAITKRVYDMAGLNSNIQVKINGHLIRIKSFKDYVSLFIDDFYYEESEDRRFKVAIAPSNGSFDVVSFVNGSACSDTGSTHVQYVINQIIAEVRPYLKKKYKIDVKPNIIRNFIKLYIDATIINPEFDSQTKSLLTTTVANFGTTFELPKSFMRNILKTDVIQSIVDYVELKAKQEENAKLRKLNKNVDGFNPRKIAKLIDAETKDRTKAKLLTTEGLSALSGLIGSCDKSIYGGYPLRGKFVNVNGIDPNKLLLNEEFKNLIVIIGLKIGIEVKSLDQLRYNKFIICCDADVDGTHIKFLLINMFVKFWPELMELNFFQDLRLPLIKVMKTWSAKEPMAEFLTEPDFEAWKEKNPDLKFVSKYFKGLGGHTSKDFKHYFKNIDSYLYDITHSNVKETVELLDLGFNSGRADDRKEWLALEEK